MSVSTMENFSGGAFAPDLARTRLKPRVPGYGLSNSTFVSHAPSAVSFSP
jgi:hypothetical protein